MPTNVVMPQLGESVVEGTVGKWLKNVGDTVTQYESIMEVVTDKVSTEVPAPAAGTLLQILVPEGITVPAGTVVALIGQPEEIGNKSTVNSQQPTASGDPSSISNFPAPVSTETPKTNGSARNRFTPVVARMIAEYNLSDAELQTIQGTGENGRISKKDVEKFVRARQAKQAAPAAAPALPAWEQPGSGDLFSPTEAVFGKQTAPAMLVPRAENTKEISAVPPAPTQAELIPLSPMRRAIAEHMVRSKTVAPHVTTFHEADMSRVIAHFEKHKRDFEGQGVKLTYTPYLIQAVVYGLQHVPLVNAQFTEQGIVMKRELHIGVAVAIDDGLIVPVIKNADDKSLLGLSRAVNDLAGRARAKKLQGDEVNGGTFTITNYGMFGSLFGTPIISQPQSAILGVGAIQKRVVVISRHARSEARREHDDLRIDDAIAIRPMVYLALSFDHRLLDGALGDTFMNKVKHFLENYPDA